MTAYLWVKHTLQAATNGIWHNLDGDLTTTKITTDTRQISEGDVFLALKGDNFDGHDFIDVAVQKGAVAVIVSQVCNTNIAQLVVDDTRLALGHLGKFRRDVHPDLTVIALTGSSGKTTTKEMLGSIFSQVAPTLITRGNLNNDLGVPMMLLELTDEHRFAVMELGANHVGEIAYTASLVRPDVACVLNIGTAHLGEFGGRDNIARTKAEIFSALTNDGVAVLPFGDEFFDKLQDEAARFTKNIITFGEKQVPVSKAGIDFNDLSDDEKVELSCLETVLLMGDVFADDVETLATCSEFTLSVNLAVDDIDSDEVTLPFIGEHNVVNALAAAAIATSLGMPLDMIKSGLNNAVPPKGRLTRMEFGDHLLIDDTYNANPNSIFMAAKVLENETAQKILVLGDVGELGDAAKLEHYKLGQKLAELELDYVLTVGQFMAHCTAAINEIKPDLARHFSNKAEVLTAIQALLSEPSAVLFKGSRTARMETLIDNLTQTPNS
ncbi:Mur ligase domain-containing protein [Moraxella nasovis]|uniref:UDP-N-acetylmuramoyl-tripeptide--D-alanyl-D- alanine ligase n=1 Tax=Moraxella nasovis TaxID=2904121 RepID=UPI001F60A63B|nr:Mur ligase family protein [Moraxella nasovis]UNU72671.1 Mur ligase domain-containing protein [Moraxella nasovis]